MIPVLAMFIALAGAGEPESLAGSVQVGRGAVTPVVSIATAEAVTQLGGELLSEVRRLASAKIEVVGLRDGSLFIVQAYRILDVGGGARPSAVGTLVPNGSSLAIADGEGAPVPLSLSPKMRLRLDRALLGKVWVVGEKLLSGEIKVSSFGILRDPPPSARAQKAESGTAH